MDKAPITIAIENGVAFIKINRMAVKNAFDEKTISLLANALKKLEKNKTIFAIVLRGEGGQFSAGADLNWMKRIKNYSKTQNKQDALTFAKFFQQFYHCSKIIIIVAEKFAFGGAVGLLAAADIVLATPETQICLSEVKLGLVPAVISPYLIKAMGPRAAKRYILTAEVFSAEKAQQLGLVHEVIPKKHIHRALNRLLDKLRENSFEAMRLSKKLIQRLTKQSYSASRSLNDTATLLANVRHSKEAQKRLDNFLEKRFSRQH